MKKIIIFVLLVLTHQMLHALNNSFVLQIQLDNYLQFKNPSALVIMTEGNHYLFRQINKRITQISIDSLVTYPQPVVVSFYKDCSEQEISDLKSVGTIRKNAFSIYFFAANGIQRLVIAKDTILLMEPTFLQKEFQQIQEEMSVRENRFDVNTSRPLHTAFMAAATKTEKDSIENLNAFLFKTNVAPLNLDSTLMPAIRNNLSNPLSFYAIREYIRIARVLQLSVPIQTFKDILAFMPETQKRYKVWSELKATVDNLSESQSLVGRPAPEFINLSDTSGNIIHLKDFKHKVVFIDFWASWCAPCKAQLPGIKLIYNNVKSNDVAFIGISLDFNVQDWKNEIRSSGLSWIQATDLKMNNGLTTVKYNVSTIPHNFLIDRNGIIADENIDLDHLEKEIKRLTTKD